MTTIFIIQGYDQVIPETNTVTNVVTIEVIAKTAEEAIKKAGGYIKKNGYRITNIIEKE